MVIAKKVVDIQAEFKQALENKKRAKAEDLLNFLKNNKSNYPTVTDMHVDHRERELFQAYYKEEDWPGAKRVVESSIFGSSRDGRIKRLEELSGKSYQEIE